jgi:hypothetical protein
MDDESDPNIDEVQRDIRALQKFSMAGAIGRAGSGLLKGESPVSPQEQALVALTQWIDQQVSDPSGALKSILRRRIRSSSQLVASHLQQPYRALREMIESILASDYGTREFVRQVDVRWGELYQERPMFQRPGQAPAPEDEYTDESVRQILTSLLEKLQEDE